MVKQTVQEWLEGQDRRFDRSKGVPRQIKYPRRRVKEKWCGFCAETGNEISAADVGRGREGREGGEGAGGSVRPKMASGMPPT
jgi:hypothetical protein